MTGIAGQPPPAAPADNTPVAESGKVKAVEKKPFRWSFRLTATLALCSVTLNSFLVFHLPSLAIRNGGGCYLLPFLVTVLVGTPGLLLSSVWLGRWAAGGKSGGGGGGWFLSPLAWGWCPLLRCVGWASFVMSSLWLLSESGRAATLLLYVAQSCRSVVPWASCDQAWASKACNRTKPTQDALYIFGRVSYDGLSSPDVWKLPAEEFFQDGVMGLAPGLGTEARPFLGWELLLSLLAVWTLLGLLTLRGARDASRVSVLLFPLLPIASVVLLGGICSLEGASDGLRAFFRPPSTDNDITLRGWLLGSLGGLASVYRTWGVVEGLSSHGGDGQTVAAAVVVQAAAALLLPLPTAALMGVAAAKARISVPNAAAEGYEGVFASAAHGLSGLGGGWAALYFATAFVLCALPVLWTFVVLVKSVVEVGRERLGPVAPAVATAAASTLFFPSIAFVSNIGVYLMTLVDSYVATWGMFLLACVQLSALHLIYASRRPMDSQMKIVLFGRSSRAFRLVLCWLLPSVCLLAAFIGWCVQESSRWPPSRALGWALSLAPLLACLVGLLHGLRRGERLGETLRGRLELALWPDLAWPDASPPTFPPERSRGGPDKPLATRAERIRGHMRSCCCRTRRRPRVAAMEGGQGKAKAQTSASASNGGQSLQPSSALPSRRSSDTVTPMATATPTDPSSRQSVAWSVTSEAEESRSPPSSLAHFLDFGRLFSSAGKRERAALSEADKSDVARQAVELNPAGFQYENPDFSEEDAAHGSTKSL